MNKLQKYLPHVYAIIGFIIIALIFFYPVLERKQLLQSDIAQYTGMAKEQNDFRKEFNEEPYWTNSAFGGMPTYQLGAKYPHHYIKSLDGFLRFLPRPADYLFLYFLGFYVLMLSFRVKPLFAFFGSLAFGFSTYLVIILGVGHNAKAHAIAYIPLVIAGINWVFQKKYIIGGVLAMLATALEIAANHFQMTYYFMFLIGIIIVYFIYQNYRDQNFKHIKNSLLILFGGVILAVGSNATLLLATKQYANFSTRSKSELTFDEKGRKKDNKNAMSYSYITEYSYGVAESLNLIAPKLTGGSNTESLGQDSEMYNFATSMGADEDKASQFAESAPTYWGDQPLVAAPAYIGIIVFFLAVLALFVSRNKIKYALAAGVFLSLILSWGKNFYPITDFFIEYVPLYNKFRAVSSIQVILELCLPILAVMGLSSFITDDAINRKKELLKASSIVGSLLVILLIFGSVFDFKSSMDDQYAKMFGIPLSEYLDFMLKDRKNLYYGTLFRSLFLLITSAVILYLFAVKKMKSVTATISVGLLMVLDLFFIGKEYVVTDSSSSKCNFVSKSEVENPFEQTAADSLILQDTTNYRVFDMEGQLSSAKASFYHQSIGGYSAVKPKKIQELYDYQITKNNIEVLNMLNVKYVMQASEEGTVALTNPNANGSAWFVSKVRVVNNADEEMKALNKLKTKEEATFQKLPLVKRNYNFKTGKDSTASIKLLSYKPNHLVYESSNSQEGYGVFSEIYYPYGWYATIDGKDAKIDNVNYVLRGLQIPAGKHKIEFKFQPDVVKRGSVISLICSILMFLVIAGGIFLILLDAKKIKNL